MGRVGQGLEIRDKSLRIKFVLDGETIRERVTLNGKSLPPTPANIKYASRLAAEVHRRLNSGTFDLGESFPDSPRVVTSKATRFHCLCDTWLASQGRLCAATRSQYASAVRFWKKLFGDVQVREINHKVVAAKIGGYPWPSAKTHNNYCIALRGVFGLEYRGAMAVHNPMTGMGNMALVRKLPDPLTIAERDTILAEMVRYDPRVLAYFQFAFFTGMRPEEMIALRWSDVDFNHESVRVQRVRTFHGNERDGSKTHAERDVDLVPAALASLKTMKQYTFMKRGAGDDTSDIFENPTTERPWASEEAQRDLYWKPTLKRLGIRGRRAYSTRHTYATAAVMAGVPAAYVAGQLGHSVQVLLEKYARWMRGADGGSARAQLAAALDSSHDSPTASATG